MGKMIGFVAVSIMVLSSVAYSGGLLDRVNGSENAVFNSAAGVINVPTAYIFGCGKNLNPTQITDSCTQKLQDASRLLISNGFIVMNVVPCVVSIRCDDGSSGVRGLIAFVHK